MGKRLFWGASWVFKIQLSQWTKSEPTVGKAVMLQQSGAGRQIPTPLTTFVHHSGVLSEWE